MLPDHEVQYPLKMVCRRHLERFEFPVEEAALACYKLSLLQLYDQKVPDQKVIEIETVKSSLRRFQLGTQTPVAFDSRSYVFFYGKNFIHELRLNKKLRCREADELIKHRKFQGCPTFSL